MKMILRICWLRKLLFLKEPGKEGGDRQLLGAQYDVPVPGIAVQTCGTSISLLQQDPDAVLTPRV